MTPTIAEILEEHVTFELERIDRLYLNGYVPGLQTPEAVAYFLRHHRGAKFAASVLLDAISRDYAKRIERFVRQHGLAVCRFAKGERKDAETQRRLHAFDRPEGVLYLGTAQEKFTTVRTEKRRNPATDQTYPWLVRGSVLAKVYYWYLVDEDFGPLFIKFGSYFPYPVKVCLDGHEFLKRQLAKAGVAYEALDNGLRSCANAALAQRLAAGLDARALAGVFAKWMSRLPQPFPAVDRAAGYDYHLSILQAEFARTQVFDRPLTGRQFFEQIIKDNVTLGHPSQLQLTTASSHPASPTSMVQSKRPPPSCGSRWRALRKRGTATPNRSFPKPPDFDFRSQTLPNQEARGRWYNKSSGESPQNRVSTASLAKNSTLLRSTDHQNNGANGAIEVAHHVHSAGERARESAVDIYARSPIGRHESGAVNRRRLRL